MRVGATVITLAASCVGALADDATEPPPRSGYRPLRFDEDWRFLRDPARRTNPFDGLKFIPVNRSGDAFLSFGGTAREVYESFRHPGFEDDPSRDGYLLHRVLVHADARAAAWLRAFGEIQDSRVTGKSIDLRPTDEDHLDLHQAFGEVDGSAGDIRWFVRGGRQELQFGSSRIVSVRDAPNVRLAFDAARAEVVACGWTVDAIAGRPVETDTHHTFDDQDDDHRALWGLYATTPPVAVVPGRLDLYWLGYQDDDAEFVQGAARERRQSAGARWFGTDAAWDFNFEGVGQWGSFGSGTIGAWTLASDTGYTLKDCALTPRIGLKADYVSGDRDADDGRLETFNALFPRGGYFGDIGIVGPANLIDLHPSVDLHVARDVTLTADCVLYWRASTDDGVYGPGGNVVRAPNGSNARYIGTQPSLVATWRLDPHVTFVATLTRFEPGEFLRESGPHRAIDYVRLEATFRF